ncbi:MAG: hypothetical protein JO163_23275 [Methylobacteriaceae bacterium]|nr:hypothetical protein [Methylobacteriaceae bacterium]MBV9705659.1 hypothetical protein [Methylobacteriaceae bacterium]
MALVAAFLAEAFLPGAVLPADALPPALFDAPLPAAFAPVDFAAGFLADALAPALAPAFLAAFGAAFAAVFFAGAFFTAVFLAAALGAADLAAGLLAVFASDVVFAFAMISPPQGSCSKANVAACYTLDEGNTDDLWRKSFAKTWAKKIQIFAIHGATMRAPRSSHSERWRRLAPMRRRLAPLHACVPPSNRHQYSRNPSRFRNRVDWCHTLKPETFLFSV